MQPGDTLKTVYQRAASAFIAGPLKDGYTFEEFLEMNGISSVACIDCQLPQGLR